jgi:transcriptional regulator with XRE-family HTH domain
MEQIRQLRALLRLSRAELARFLGVSEPTVVRWESDRGMTEPRGLQAVLLQVLTDATTTQAPQSVARIVRSCGVNHRDALRTLLASARER